MRGREAGKLGNYPGENVAQGLGRRAAERVLAAAGPRPRLGCRAVRQAAVAVPFPGKSFFVTVSSLPCPCSDRLSQTGIAPA